VVGVVGLGVGVAVGGAPDRPVPPATATEEPAPTGTAVPTTPATLTSPPPSSPPPSSPPPTTATAGPEPSTPLLVSGDAEAAIYRLPAGSDEAVRVRPLEPPAAPGQLRSPGWGALSAGEDPVACLRWQVSEPDHTAIEESIACYPPGSSDPVLVPLPDGIGTRAFALRSDASEIAVVSTAPETYGTIAVSRLDDDLAPVGWRTWPSGVDDQSATIGVAFAGTSDRLLVSVENAPREDRGLRVLDLTTAGTPWSGLDRVVPQDADARYDRPAGLDGTTALAQLDDIIEDTTAAVAVVIDLADGSVLRTVAHPQRNVARASGTQQVLVYSVRDREVGAPSSDEALLHFVLRAGQQQASPLSGLPDEAHLDVVAGPPAP
jgi:hypothetical protein